MKKLAIVGAEEHTRSLAPWGDPEFDIWLFNEWANASWCQRWDALLQLHKPEVYRNFNRKDSRHWEWLQRKHNKPIYMQEVDPLVPDSVKLPDLLPKKLLYEGKKQKYFRATVCYAIALALFKGYKEIHIYGVELSHHAEYKSQRDCFIFWIGVAIGQGATINLHCCKGLFDAPLYGFEEYMQEDQIQRYLEGITQQIAEAKSQLDKLEGARMLLIQMIEDQKGKASEGIQEVR